MENENKKYIEEQLKMVNRSNNDREYLNSFFDFELPDYVVMSLVENDYYDNFCALTNLSKVNGRITEKQANQIKAVIKYLCHIKNGMDRVSDDFISELYNNPESPDFIEWKQHYYNDEKYDIYKIFSKEEIETIKKLNIKLLDKVYTAHEYEVLELNLLDYYDDEEEDDPIIEDYKKNLSDVNVSQEEYNKVLDTLYKTKV